MNILHAAILGIVEGVTEFLPVSSTGHLVLAERLMGLAGTDFAKTFAIVIQSGAMCAVIALYGKRVWRDRSMWGKIAAAFAPTAVVGLLFYRVVKDYLLGSEAVVVWALGIGGLLMIGFEWWYGRRGDQGYKGDDGLERISYRQSLVIGLFQSLAIVPGVSRSAATIIGGLLLGISRKAIVEFSFLLAVPTIFAATALDLWKSAPVISGNEWGLLGVGFAGSLLSAWWAIRWFLSYISRHTFVAFGVYRMVAGLIFFVVLRILLTS